VADRLLLDTHAFLWSAVDPAFLSKSAREAIEDSSNEVFVSAAAAWEIVVKHALGKLTLPLDPATYVLTRLARLGFKPLSIDMVHTLAVASLPNHHADPFDRIMIAQAQVEGLLFVTADDVVMRYPVRTMRAA
jgi:PIN domain nuclease of toxin-antitoxin system